MRILVISTLEAVPWGGSEELWHVLASRFLNGGHSIGIHRIEWHPVPDKLQQLIQQGAVVSYWPNVHIARSRANLVFKVRNRIYNHHPFRAIEAFQPDCILISQGGTFDPYLDRLAPFLLQTKIPYLLLSQHMPEYLYVDNRRRALLRQLFLKAAQVFFVSNRNKLVTERTLATYFANASLINNPVKIKKDIQVPYPEAEQALWACVARLDVPFKGQDVLLQVLSSEKWRHRNWHLSFYGTGPHKSYLQDLVLLYNLQEKISFKDYCEDVTTIWTKHQLLIMPSHSEGTPLSLLEACYCSRAAVVTDVGGNAEVVLNNQTGFIAESSSLRSLDMCLERAWLHKKDWQEMGKAARVHVGLKTGYNDYGEIVNVILQRE